MVIILLIFISLICVGISRQQTNSLSQVNIMALRGICAFEIMMGHIGIATGSIWLYPNRKAGILFVGIFFMLSGYGLRYSLDNKKNYLNKFLINHFVKIVPIAYLVFILGMLGCHFINGTELNKLWFISVKEFLSGANWYVGEILLFYLIFWASYKFFDRQIAKYIILGASVVIILMCYLCRFDNPWYGSTICFWLGAVWYENEDYIRDKSKKVGGGVYLIAIFILAISILIFMIDGDGIIGLILARNIASASFCIVVSLILYNIKIGNKITNMLGIYSYAIYLVHPWIIELLKDDIQSMILYSLVVIVLSIFVAGILTYFIKFMNNLMKRN